MKSYIDTYMENNVTDVYQDRSALEALLNTADYQGAVKKLREFLKRHLMRVLGGDWDKIHNEYGMYTINCRVKSPRRTLEKFDSMRKAGVHVDVGNFYNLMPDLVGGRLVVVDPVDLFGLAERVRAGWVSPLFESPLIPLTPCRVRHGRFSMYDTARFDAAGYKIEPESTGYCSVHFVYRPARAFFNQQCHDAELSSLRNLDDRGIIPLEAWHLEVQVRTIMDEAWGETDHFVRYEDPSLKDDDEIKNQFSALAAYLQAANHHVSVILETARRKRKTES